MSTTLPLFWDLSSNSKPERITASVKLVRTLEELQSQFAPDSPSEKEDEESDVKASSDGLDVANAPDVAYSVRRLVRGLASPRESSRLGFAVALTELLSRLDTISASQILSLIFQATQVHGSMKGQEERDMIFARLFGITSLVKSGVLFRSLPLSTSSMPACTFEDFRNAMEMLLVLPSKKSFLREPSYWTFVLSLRALYCSGVHWKEDGWSWVSQAVFSDDKTWSPEKVGITLTMQSLGVREDWEPVLKSTFKSGEILSVGGLRNLAKILTDMDIEVPDANDVKLKGSNLWKPQLHWVWKLILDIYYPPDGVPPSKLRPKLSFPEFFAVVADDFLLAPTASDGRKLWGFELFRLALSRVPASELPRLFTPNFVRSWVNHLSEPNRYLHRAAKLIASSLPPLITANPSIGFPLILQLTQIHGHFNRLTRTKTVESMLAAMDVKGVQDYVDHLGHLACSSVPRMSEESESDPTAIRIWVTDQFLALIRSGTVPKADEWVSDVLDFFILHGLFAIKKKNRKSKNKWLHLQPEPAFSKECRIACRKRLLSSLAELMTQTMLVKLDGDKTVRRTGVASDCELWISKILHRIVDLENDAKLQRLGDDEEYSQKETVIRDQILKLITELRIVSPDRREAAEGAELLLVATLLYRRLHDDGDEADEDIETCITSVKRLFPDLDQESGKKKKREGKKLAGLQELEDVRPIDALVDTLVGYLEASSAYLRVVANQVFTRLTEVVDLSTIDLILTQLERRDPTKIDDDSISLQDEPMDDSAQSDSEEKSTNEQEIEEDDEDIEDDPELKEKIEEAFKMNDIQFAAEGSDDDSVSASTESVMDDDQMMKLDENLAEIFRSRTKEKASNYKGAQREATHFKNRVLDLVDIFLKKQPTNKFVPRFLLPLVQVITGAGSDEKQLSDKVAALLRSRFVKAKEVPSSVDLPEVRKTLGGLHGLARKSHSAEIREIISGCSLYCAKVMLSDNVNDAKTVVDAYRATLEDFATRKASHLQPSFIQDFVQRHPKFAWKMRDDFIQLASKAINAYRKCQTIQLLLPLLKQLGLASGDLSETKEFMIKLRQYVYAIISDACEDADSLTVPQLRELLRLCLLAVRQTKRSLVGEDDLQDIWDPTTSVELSVKIEKSRFKTTSIQGICKQLLAVIGSNSSPAVNGGGSKGESRKKRKAGEAAEDNEANKARKTKR